MNMLSLFMTGFTVENYLQSKWKYISLVIMGGVGGNLFSDVANPYVISVGASGAIYAIIARYGVYLAFNYRKLGKASYPFLIFFGIMTVFGFINGFTTPGVDGYGHLGGVITGALLSTMLKPHGEEVNPLELKMRIPLFILLIFYTVLMLILVFVLPLPKCDSS